MLLNPRSSFQAECRRLSHDVAATAPLQYFLCEDVRACDCFYTSGISIYSDIAKCECGRSLNRGIKDVDCREHEDEAFVISPMFFIIADDLRVAPIVDGIAQALAGFGIADTDQGAEMKSLSLGFDEIRELLKLSLTSATPLTDMIMKNTVENQQSEIGLDHIEQDNTAPEWRKLVLRAFFHKSTNEFLFAEATSEFVEFLFSFLALPLGGVEFLLGGNIGLKSIDNLYRSVSNGIDDKYFSTPDTKNRLINPKLAHGYRSKNQFLPLIQEGPPKVLYRSDTKWKLCASSFHEKEATMIHSFKPRKKVVFVKKQTMCFVNDDLTMSPSFATRISILNDARIPLSDVKQTEFQVGLDEALGLLKISLISKTALTDGLIKPMLKRQPMKER